MKYKIIPFFVSTIIAVSCIDSGRKAEYYNNMAYEQLVAEDYAEALINYNKAIAFDSLIADKKLSAIA